MQVELSLDELRAIVDSMMQDDMLDSIEGRSEIFQRLTNAISEAEELESIDLNDCAGGACKL